MLSRQTATHAKTQDSLLQAGPRPLPNWLTTLCDQRGPVLLLGLAAAVLLPQIPISSRLPDIRLEQLLLPYALIVFWVDRRLGKPFRLGFLDWIFAALALSTIVSIVCAPLILRTRLSPRDFYELLKLALYYCFYRLALDVGSKAGIPDRLLNVFLLTGALAGLFALFQYFDWLQLNRWLTPLFAPDHHLAVLRESGRVVGTLGNPNYFGITSVLLLLAAVSSFWLRAPDPEEPRSKTVPAALLVLAAAAVAALGLIMSGSRTALFAFAGGMVAMLVLAVSPAAARRGLARFLLGGAVAGLLLILAIAFVEAFPRGSVDYLGRVGDGLNVNEDASFGLRLVRWRSVIDAWLPMRQVNQTIGHVPVTSLHATGVQQAAPDVLARDAQRKDDLLHLATAIDAYRRATGNWPDPANVAGALVPRYVASLPRDPATGEAYPVIPTVVGYSLMARLENAADPDYPIYGIGTSPNYLLNGDLERGGARPSNWSGIPGTSFSAEHGDSLFGERAVIFRGDPSRPQQRAGIFQQRFFGRPGGNPFTATVWIKIPRPEPGLLELYANVIYADGERADPLTRIPADMSRTGVWQKVSLGILPPSGKTIAYLGIYVVSEGFTGQALLDGFQLVDGSVPLSFALTREAPPAETAGFNPEASSRRSPIIGVGPQKGEQGSSIDDEYLLYAARYGLAGILLYLALYFGTLVLAIRGFIAARSAAARALAALIVAAIVAFLIFNITAGSFYELQLMAIFWLLAGAALAGSRAASPPTGDTMRGR